MRKIKTLAIITAILFLLLNTIYFWQKLFGEWIMLVWMVMIPTFIFLVISALWQIFLTISEKLKFKPRIYLLSFMIPVLVLIYLTPFGIIDFYKFEKEDKLTAYQVGTANCSVTLKLKDDHDFIIRNICFVLSEEGGKYILKKDTIKFEYAKYARGDKFFKFGILDTAQKTVYMYRSDNDKYPYPMHITKNRLKQP